MFGGKQPIDHTCMAFAAFVRLELGKFPRCRGETGQTVGYTAQPDTLGCLRGRMLFYLLKFLEDKPVNRASNPRIVGVWGGRFLEWLKRPKLAVLIRHGRSAFSFRLDR